jgi:hypothetical protein
VLGLIRQSIKGGLELHACSFERRLIGFARNPDWTPIQKYAFRKWERDHIAIPAREEFFFEQAKANGTIGRPVAFAR